jgi:hypothetical protein
LKTSGYIKHNPFIIKHIILCLTLKTSILHNWPMPRKRRNLPPSKQGRVARGETWGHLVCIEILGERIAGEQLQYAMLCDCGNECFVRAGYFTDKYKVKCCADVDRLDTGYIAGTLSDPTLVDPCCCQRCLAREERGEEYAFRDKCKKERARPMGRPKSKDPGKMRSFYVPDSIMEIIQQASKEGGDSLSKAMSDLVRTGKMFRDAQEEGEEE